MFVNLSGSLVLIRLGDLVEALEASEIVGQLPHCSGVVVGVLALKENSWSTPADELTLVVRLSEGSLEERDD